VIVASRRLRAGGVARSFNTRFLQLAGRPWSVLVTIEGGAITVTDLEGRDDQKPVWPELKGDENF
jgi:hypothetical protein